MFESRTENSRSHLIYPAAIFRSMSPTCCPIHDVEAGEALLHFTNVKIKWAKIRMIQLSLSSISSSSRMIPSLWRALTRGANFIILPVSGFSSTWLTIMEFRVQMFSVGQEFPRNKKLHHFSILYSKFEIGGRWAWNTECCSIWRYLFYWRPVS